MSKKMDKIDARYEQVDIKALLDLCVAFIQVQEKMYGPVYSRMAKKYTMQFAAKKLGEKPPESSEEWNWPLVKEYLMKNVERYPYIFNALSYSMAKTQLTLQGQAGTGRNSAAKVAKHLNTSQHSEVSNIDQAWKQTVDALVSFKIMPPETSYSIMDENTIKYVVHNCPYRDSCDAFIAENITNIDGSPICSIGRALSSDIGQKIITGCDYILDEFKDSSCTVRILKIL